MAALPPPLNIKFTWDPSNGPLGPTPNSGNSDQLVIGSTAFLDEETPNDLSFKLNQVLAVHQLIGGSRTIQAVGPSMEDVTWKGELFAGNVAFRIGQLETLNVAAAPVALTYLTYSYQVIVKNFTWKFLHRWRAQYEITVTVLSDTSGQYTTTPPPGMDQQVNGLTQAVKNTVNQIVSQDQINTVSVLAACNAMFLALELAGVLSQLTGPALQSLLQTVSQAFVAAQLYQNSLGVNGSSLQFALATQLTNQLGLIQKNLQQGQAPNVMIVHGGSGDLFDIAASVYGDASLGFALAQANGLLSPILSFSQDYQIVLPPLTSGSQ